MKFKYNFLAISLLGAMAVSCEPMEDIYNEIDAQENPIKKTDEYVLTKADYESISKAALNKEKEEPNQELKNAALKVKSELALNELVSADAYIPAILSKLYPSWGKGSSVGVTYEFHEPADDFTAQFTSTAYVNVSSRDYETIWKNEGFNPGFLTPKHKPYTEIPNLLKAKYPNAEANQYVLVDYRYDENDTKPFFLKEDFGDIKDKKDITLYNWKQIVIKGDNKWQGNTYSGNQYAELSAYQAKNDVEVALITPEVKLTLDNMAFSFDTKFRFSKGKCLSVYVSEKYKGGDDFVESDWVNITEKLHFPKKDNKFENSGKYQLNEYKNKSVRFAFVYRGSPNGVTTTVQLDNVWVADVNCVFSNEKPYTDFYKFDGKSWKTTSVDDVIVLKPEDYNEMGITGRYLNFGSSNKPENYIPQFLAPRFVYAQKGDRKIVLNKYYDSKEKVTVINADRYDFDGTWIYNNNIVTRVNETFMRIEDKWVYDPSVKYTFTKDDFQLLVEWTRSNKPAYLDKDHPDNSEFYFGASSYYANFNTDKAKRRTNDSENMFSKDDTEMDKQMKQKIAEGINIYLEATYPDAPAVKYGLDMYYHISCKVYPGVKPDKRFTYKFKGLGNGKFELEGDPIEENW